MAEYSKAQLTEMIVGKLHRNFGRDVEDAGPNHIFKACALVLRDIMSAHQMETGNRVWEDQQRQVHYRPWSSSWAALWRRTPTISACWIP